MSRLQTKKETMHRTLGGSDKHETAVVGCVPVFLRATISLDEGWQAAAGSWEMRSISSVRPTKALVMICSPQVEGCLTSVQRWAWSEPKVVRLVVLVR